VSAIHGRTTSFAKNAKEFGELKISLIMTVLDQSHPTRRNASFAKRASTLLMKQAGDVTLLKKNALRIPDK
jgi:hypothetical protein